MLLELDTKLIRNGNILAFCCKNKIDEHASRAQENNNLIGIYVTSMLFCDHWPDYSQKCWIDGATYRHRILALGFELRGRGKTCPSVVRL